MDDFGVADIIKLRDKIEKAQISQSNSSSNSASSKQGSRGNGSDLNGSQLQAKLLATEAVRKRSPNDFASLSSNSDIFSNASVITSSSQNTGGNNSFHQEVFSTGGNFSNVSNASSTTSSHNIPKRQGATFLGEQKGNSLTVKVAYTIPMNKHTTQVCFTYPDQNLIMGLNPGNYLKISGEEYVPLDAEARGGFSIISQTSENSNVGNLKVFNVGDTCEVSSKAHGKLSYIGQGKFDYAGRLIGPTKHLVLICADRGIAAIIQLLNSLIRDIEMTGTKMTISVIYAIDTVEDALFQDILDGYIADYKSIVNLVHVIHKKLDTDNGSSTLSGDIVYSKIASRSVFETYSLKPSRCLQKDALVLIACPETMTRQILNILEGMNYLSEQVICDFSPNFQDDPSKYLQRAYVPPPPGKLDIVPPPPGRFENIQPPPPPSFLPKNNNMPPPPPGKLGGGASKIAPPPGLF